MAILQLVLLPLHLKLIIMAIIVKVKGMEPTWGDACFIAENATLTGNCHLGDGCSIWYGAVLRADVDGIRCGNRVNVQDCACLHQSQGTPCILDDDVSVGHGAVVHGATVHHGALIGMNATVLDGAEVGPGAIVAAGAVVTRAPTFRPTRYGAAYRPTVSRLVSLARPKSTPATTLAISKTGIARTNNGATTAALYLIIYRHSHDR